MGRFGKSTLWFFFVGICTHELYALLSGYILALNFEQFETRPLWQRSLLEGGLQEPLLLLVCLTVFFVAGAILLVPYRLRRGVSVAIAFLFGLLFSGLFLVEEHGIFFAHAPAWLYTLAWSPFYVPPIAAAFGALTSPRIKVWGSRHMSSSPPSEKNAH